VGQVNSVDIINGMFDVDGNGVVNDQDIGRVGRFDVLAGMVSLAQSGIASLSSTLGNFTADLSLDGVLTNFSHTTVGSNSATSTEYWQVDLGASQAISDITVFNRDANCCIGRLEGVVLMVSDTPFPDDANDFNGALANADFTSVLSVVSDNDPFVAVDIDGRYVRLQKGGGNIVNGNVVENFGNGGLTTGGGRGIINFAELKVTPSDYTFSGLLDGDYRLVVTDENALLNGYDLTNGVSLRDIVVDGSGLSDVDFAYVGDEQTGSISGEVFIDNDGNSIANDTETNLANVDVFLCSAPLLDAGVSLPDNQVAFERYDGAFSSVTQIETGTLTQSTMVSEFVLIPQDLDNAVENFGYIYRGFITLDESGVHEFSTRSD